MNVSVVLASFNGARYIGEQIESILCEIQPDDELIVTDDGSTDGTLAILEQFVKRDARVILLQGPRNGFLKNFEFGIMQATGDIIILADQDDVWLKGRLHLVVQEIELRNAELVIVSGRLVDDNLRPVAVNNERFKFRPGFWTNLWQNRFTGNFMAFVSDFRNEFLPIPGKLDYHDSWIGLIASLNKKKIVYLNSELILFRRHAENQSGKRRNLLKVFYSRIKLIFYLFLKMIHR